MIADEGNPAQSSAVADEREFMALLEGVADGAYRLALTMLQDPEQAADAVQEAAFRAWRKRGQLRAETSFRAWFLAIVANECRAVRRRRWWSLTRQPSPPETGEWAEDRAIGSIDVRRLLVRLPADQRAALFLHYYLDLAQPEVAAVLGITVAAAKSRIQRGLEKLRRQLEVEETR